MYIREISSQSGKSNWSFRWRLDCSHLFRGKTYNIHGKMEAVWKAHTKVVTLITLGTPHLSQERWTKKNLDFVQIMRL